MTHTSSCPITATTNFLAIRGHMVNSLHPTIANAVLLRPTSHYAIWFSHNNGPFLPLDHIIERKGVRQVTLVHMQRGVAGVTDIDYDQVLEWKFVMPSIKSVGYLSDPVGDYDRAMGVL